MSSNLEQVRHVADDLNKNFWHEQARVIANSFGAYLFLHAQFLMRPYVGKVMLLSPIVGEFESNEWKVGFSPPYPTRLKEAVASGIYPTPKHCEIHVGQEDWQSVPVNVQALGKKLNIQVTVVPNTGHVLENTYVTKVLDRWLEQ